MTKSLTLKFSVIKKVMNVSDLSIIEKLLSTKLAKQSIYWANQLFTQS